MTIACRAALVAVAVAATFTTTTVIAQSQPVRTVEQRLSIVEQQLRSQTLINMLQEVRALRREVNALRGDNEVLNNRIDKLTQNVRDLSGDLERRLPSNATAGAAVSAPAGQPDVAQPATGSGATAGAAPVVSTGNPQEDYQGAVDQLMAGDYGGAVTAFEGFLTVHADSQYAGNAMYWLAETYYQQERTSDALAAYGQLVATHPSHAKVPEASLKSAFILDEQGKRQEAVTALQAILRDYPGSSVEPLARQRLADIQRR